MDQAKRAQAHTQFSCRVISDHNTRDLHHCLVVGHLVVEVVAVAQQPSFEPLQQQPERQQPSFVPLQQRSLQLQALHQPSLHHIQLLPSSTVPCNPSPSCGDPLAAVHST